MDEGGQAMTISHLVFSQAN